ncbi:MAG: RluA family pseudouridine synthase, partial [Clostridia bacterium]|nr:RluA family pseudouridine synthase [Clostridia bacterium]
EISNGHTLAEFELETGRTHQIRVHMSSIGHPLAGDDMYGGSLKYISRQALHCAQISFKHPVTKEAMIIKSDLPTEFYSILARNEK